MLVARVVKLRKKPGNFSSTFSVVGHSQEIRTFEELTCKFKVEAHLGPGTSRTLLLTDYM